jgi:hypothetical protein
MSLFDLNQIKEKVLEIAKQINAPSILLPTFGVNKDFAQPEIRVDGKGYHFVIVERGSELKHQIVKDIDELLYLVFKDITFSMACEYELNNRIEGQDFRRILFSKQLELLSKISDIYYSLGRKEIEEILVKNPFNDKLGSCEL